MISGNYITQNDDGGGIGNNKTSTKTKTNQNKISN